MRGIIYTPFGVVERHMKKALTEANVASTFIDSMDNIQCEIKGLSL